MGRNLVRLLRGLLIAAVGAFVGSAMLAGAIDAIRHPTPDNQAMDRATAPTARAGSGPHRAAQLAAVPARARSVIHPVPHDQPSPVSDAPSERYPNGRHEAQRLDVQKRAIARLTGYGFKVRELTILPGAGAARPCPGSIAILDIYTGNSFESARDRTALATEILFDHDYDIHRVMATAYQKLEDRGETDHSLYCVQTDLGEKPIVFQDYDPPTEG